MQYLNAYFHRTFSSLSIRNYRIYSVGQIISQSGTWIQAVAQSWLVLQLTNSATMLGLLMAAQFLPALLFGPMIGVYIDRLPHRKLIMCNQLFGTFFIGLFSVLLLTHHTNLPIIFLFTFIGGIVMAIDIPARQTFVYEMVGEEELRNAITLNSLIANVARMIGPALGALLIAGVSLEFCFVVNAVSYLASFVALFMFDASTLQKIPRAHKQRGQIRDGLRYVMTNSTAKAIFLAMLLVGLFVSNFAVTLPLLAKYTFNGNADAYALFAGAMGFGSIIGGLISAGHKNANLITLGHVCMMLGAGMCGVALAPSLITAVILLALSGGAMIILTSGANALMLLHTTPEMRGRMNALWTMMFIGTTPIGGPLIGWLSQHSNAQIGFVIGGVAAFVAATAITGHGLIHVRRGGRLITVQELR